MPVKYIRPSNLITDRKTTKLVKQKKFISEEEYEMKMSVIQELLNELNLENFQIDENIKNDYENFSKVRDDISEQIEIIVNYIDTFFTENEYDIEQIKTKISNYIREEYEKIKEIFENDMYVYYADYIYETYTNIKKEEEKNKENKQEYKRCLFNNDKFVIDTDLKIKNMKNNDFFIIYDDDKKIILNHFDNICIQNPVINDLIKNTEIESIECNENTEINNSGKFLYENKFLVIDEIKCVNIKKRCSKIDFDFKLDKYSFIYFYVDGSLVKAFNQKSSKEEMIFSDDEHVFSWTLIGNSVAQLYNIKYDDIIDMNDENYNKEEYIETENDEKKFFIYKGIGIKTISIKKSFISMSFDIDLNKSNLFLYIDDIFVSSYSHITDNISKTYDEYEEHTITWIFFNYSSESNSIMTNILFDGIEETTQNNFYDEINNNIINNFSSSKEDGTYISPSVKNGYFSIICNKRKCSKVSFKYDYTEENARILFYIDDKLQTVKKTTNDYSLNNENHEFVWILYGSSTVISEISFDDILETDINNFNSNINLEKLYKKNCNYFYNNTSTPKKITIKKKCTKLEYKYTNGYTTTTVSYGNGSYYTTGVVGGYIYLYIDKKLIKINGGTDNKTDKEIIENLSDEEHEITWILIGNNFISIDNIIFDDNEEIKEQCINEYLSQDNELFLNNNDLLFYNLTNEYSVRIESKKICSSLSFEYMNDIESCVHLYIDGFLYKRFSSTEWNETDKIELENKEHIFEWVLVCNSDQGESIIRKIKYDEIEEDNINNFNKKITSNNNAQTSFKNEIQSIEYSDDIIYFSHKKNSFGLKDIISIRKTCSKISFRLFGIVYIYIDGKFHSSYQNKNSKSSPISIEVEEGEHEFLWIGNINDISYISSVVFDDDKIPNINEFKKELYNSNNLGLTYNNHLFNNYSSKIAIVSITKYCSKISFKYCNHVILYIDGILYKVSYNTNSSSSSATANDINIEEGEHEFTWILDTYSYLENVKFDDVEVQESDINKNNIITINNDLNNIQRPYIDYSGSIKRTCSRISFYYFGKIAFYIDDNFYDLYSSTSYTNSGTINVEQGEHKFSWILQTSESYLGYITVDGNNIIDFDYEDITPNNSNDIDFYFNPSLSSNKSISVTKVCSNISFKYLMNRPICRILFFIDNLFYKEFKSYNEDVIINDFKEGEHKFTFFIIPLMKNYNDLYEQRKDNKNVLKIYDIKFDGNVVTNKNIFSEDNINIDEFDNDHYNKKYFYYNDKTSYKINTKNGEIKTFSITKKCKYISFGASSNNDFLVYKDGELLYSIHNGVGQWWKSSTFDLGEYKFTFILFENSYIQNIMFDNYYLPINEIKFDANEFNIEDNINNNDSSYVVLYNLTHLCSKVNFKYKLTNSNTWIKLYIDGVFHGKYGYNDTSWKEIDDIVFEESEHTFTWLLYKYTYGSDSVQINDIKFDDEIIEEENKTKTLVFKNDNNYIINNIFTIAQLGKNYFSTSINKECSKLTFEFITMNSRLFLYIDKKYYKTYTNSSSIWTSSEEITLEEGEHEFTWISIGSKSLIRKIYTDDEEQNDKNIFINNDISEMDQLIGGWSGFSDVEPYFYIYRYIGKTNYSQVNYNKFIMKNISINKTCSKIKFDFKIINGICLLYIDKKYYKTYTSSSSSWISSNEITLEEGEHEFTWILCLFNINNNSYCALNNIEFDNIMEDKNNFMESPYIYNINKNYSDDVFYNTENILNGFSIKKTCSKIKFDYKCYGNSLIYLYIDGIIYKIYSSSTWTSSEEITLEEDEHEIIIFSISKCEIKDLFIDDVKYDLIYNKDEFLNEYNDLLFFNNNNNLFIFNNRKINIKNIKKTCSKIKFDYALKNENSFIDFYIDKKIYKRYFNREDDVVEKLKTVFEKNGTIYKYDESNQNNNIEITIKNLKEIKFNVETPYTSYGYCYIRTSNGNSLSVGGNSDNLKKVFSYSSTKSFDLTIELSPSNKRIYAIIYNLSFKLSTDWNSSEEFTFEEGEHEFAWVSNDNVGIRFINFDNEYEENKNFDNDENYILNSHGYKISLDDCPIYSYKKRCSKLEFNFKGTIILYIDRKFYKTYYSSENESETIILEENMHEFVWIKYTSNNTNSYIYDIKLDDENIVCENYQICEFSLPDINIIDMKKNIDSDENKIKFSCLDSCFSSFSIKKYCSKLNFNFIGNVYLYIDRKFYKKYINQAFFNEDIDLEDDEHEFTWILSYGSYIFNIYFDNLEYKIYHKKENKIIKDILNKNYINCEMREIKYNNFYYIKNIRNEKTNEIEMNIEGNISRITHPLKTFNNIKSIDSEDYNEYLIYYNNKILKFKDFIYFYNLINSLDEFGFIIINEDKEDDIIFEIDTDKNFINNKEEIELVSENDKEIQIINNSNYVELYKKIKYIE